MRTHPVLNSSDGPSTSTLTQAVGATCATENISAAVDTAMPYVASKANNLNLDNKSLRNYVLSFIAKLYSNKLIPRSHIFHILDDVVNLLSSGFLILRENIKKKLLEKQIDDGLILEICM